MTPKAERVVALKLYTQYGADGRVVLSKEFTQSNLNSMAAANPIPSGGYLYHDNKVLATNLYVLVDQLLDDAGVTFEPGDALKVSSDDASYTFTFGEIQNSRYFYPSYDGTSERSVEGRMVVPGPGIAISWNSEEIGTKVLSDGTVETFPTADVAYQYALQTAYNSGNTRFFIGLSEESYLNDVEFTGKRLIRKPESLTVIKPASADPGPDPSVDPAKPVDPADPGPDPSVDPADPGPDPSVDPAKPIDPADPSLPSSPDEPSEPTVPDYSDVVLDFIDVGLGEGEEEHWIVSGGHLRKVVGMGLMGGWYEESGCRVFGPDESISRGQVATVLYRAAYPDSDLTSSPEKYMRLVNTTPFVDGEDGAYFTAALNWAYAAGVLMGSDDGTGLRARPYDSITRQELATMLQRFAAMQGDESSGDGAWRGCPDSADVAPWARDAIDWCFTQHIMTGVGKDGPLMPEATATRAEMAKMIVVTLEVVGRA